MTLAFLLPALIEKSGSKWVYAKNIGAIFLVGLETNLRFRIALGVNPQGSFLPVSFCLARQRLVRAHSVASKIKLTNQQKYGTIDYKLKEQRVFLLQEVFMLNRFEQFSVAIAGIHRYIQKLERSEMEKSGFKGAFAQYLVVLRRYPNGVTSSQLCEICDKDKAAISRIVAEMEEKGLVFRTGGRDGRYRALLQLTEKGQQTAAHVCDKVKTAVEAVGRAVSDEERASMYAALELIASTLDRLSKEGIPGDAVD